MVVTNSQIDIESSITACGHQKVQVFSRGSFLLLSPNCLKVGHAFISGESACRLVAKGAGKSAGGTGGPCSSGTQGCNFSAESRKIPRPLWTRGGVECHRH